jgi:hypothetical protein
MKNREKPKAPSKVKPKTSLRDLIDSINWIAIEGTRGMTKLPLEAVSIHFTQKTKNHCDGTKADLVRIRLGQGVMQKLGWEPGSRIFISYDPDDQLTFLLSKVESINAHKLCQETGSHASRIHFSWGKERLPMEKGNPIIVEYEIHKKQLIFRASGT